LNHVLFVNIRTQYGMEGRLKRMPMVTGFNSENANVESEACARTARSVKLLPTSWSLPRIPLAGKCRCVEIFWNVRFVRANVPGLGSGLKPMWRADSNIGNGQSRDIGCLARYFKLVGVAVVLAAEVEELYTQMPSALHSLHLPIVMKAPL